MYTTTGANLHGQWQKNNPLITGFQTLSSNSVHFDKDGTKLIYISWSYNLYRDANKVDKYYLSGSWNGNINQIIEVPLPKECCNCKESHLLLIGNDYNLFLFDINLYIMWVINLENPEDFKKINLNTEMLVADVTKRSKKIDPIVKVCASNLNCVSLTACGTVHSGALPSPLDTSRCSGKVCDVQCGYEHCLLLTDTGHVYSWGNGRRLQLGHGNLNNIECPTQIEALAGIKIIEISVGGWHSLALSEFGDIYAWGWNDTGQLGIKEVESASNEKTYMHKSSMQSYGLPTLVDINDENDDVVNTSVKHIACGSRHSAILLGDNSVWTTGCNKYGQLGFQPETTKKVLSFKKSYQCSGDSSIRCGPWVTVIEITA